MGNAVRDQKSFPSVIQAYRCERGHLVFFDGKHEDRENQEGGDEHLDEHALSGVDSLLQLCAATHTTVKTTKKLDEETTHL